MGHKTAALQSIKGIDTGKLPYAPRFDLWFNAHLYRGTLPEDYHDCDSPLDIARKIGVSGNLIIPDYLRVEDPSRLFDRGIGLHKMPQIPYKYKLKGVERTVEIDGSKTTVTYKTPKGSVSVSFGFTEDMLRAGNSISRITKHAIIDEKDFDPLIFLFEHIEVIPFYDDLERMIKEVGEDALVVAKCSSPASPMQYIMRDLMDMTHFFLALSDNPHFSSR